MLYLVGQILVFLIITALWGFLMGFFLSAYIYKRKLTKIEKDHKAKMEQSDKILEAVYSSLEKKTSALEFAFKKNE